ncbi:uncharacterized protein LOC115990004 [Quercus lobata]|uniref:uncharacterized protein LOC115990004 n=1 Tax=Quercus lobata TaxID=97700 RepID=UPI0012488783|nr:uncharacterized protein LOC115990004 [Quercus lobata]
MKLNPSKCAFGVSSGKFLGFMVSHRRIEVNPNKIQVILDVKPPQNTKEIQSLTGQVAALNRKAFEWTDECQRVFEDLKAYLTMALLLSPSVVGEELYLYLAVTPHAVSSALIREEDKVQRPMYYTSKALRGAEGRYPQMEKLAFALITASRKLRHYFQAHVINVMTDHPLKKAMNRLEAAGRLIQWTVELNEFDIRYQPRHAIKAQALADFIVEFIPNHDETEDSKRWVVHVDGSSTRHAGGIGVVLQSPEGDKLKHKVCLQYQATNNEVEYEALLKGLELAKFVETKSILFLGDSQLVMGQVNGMYEVKEERMRKYLSRVMCLMKRFEKTDFVQIPKEENVEADTIAKEASANEYMDEFDEVQYMSSIDIPEVQQVESRGNLITPIISYLRDGRLPEEKDEARKLRVRSTRTTVRTPTGKTPFKVAYGSEAVIPAEVHMANHRVTMYEDKDNEEQLRLNLDLIDEVRVDAEHRAAKYKNLMARQYGAMVKPRRFNIGDLVLRKVSLATKNPGHGKLSPNWEGPYRVINYKRQGFYYLEALDGRKLEHPWNVEHLRRYYQ